MGARDLSNLKCLETLDPATTQSSCVLTCGCALFVSPTPPGRLSVPCDSPALRTTWCCSFLKTKSSGSLEGPNIPLQQHVSICGQSVCGCVCVVSTHSGRWGLLSSRCSLWTETVSCEESDTTTRDGFEGWVFGPNLPLLLFLRLFLGVLLFCSQFNMNKWSTSDFMRRRPVCTTHSQFVSVESDASIFSIGGIWPYSLTAFASLRFSPDFSSCTHTVTYMYTLWQPMCESGWCRSWTLRCLNLQSWLWNSRWILWLSLLWW